MRHAFWNVRDFADFQQPLLLTDPLFEFPSGDINDFFPLRMHVEVVSVIGWHGCADQKEFFRTYQLRSGQGFDVAPGKIRVLNLAEMSEMVIHDTEIQFLARSTARAGAPSLPAILTGRQIKS